MKKSTRTKKYKAYVKMKKKWACFCLSDDMDLSWFQEQFGKGEILRHEGTFVSPGSNWVIEGNNLYIRRNIENEFVARLYFGPEING